MGRGDGTGTSFLGLPNLRQLNTKSGIRMRCKNGTFREIGYTSILYTWMGFPISLDKYYEIVKLLYTWNHEQRDLGGETCGLCIIDIQ